MLVPHRNLPFTVSYSSDATVRPHRRFSAGRRVFQTWILIMNLNDLKIFLFIVKGSSLQEAPRAGFCSLLLSLSFRGTFLHEFYL